MFVVVAVCLLLGSQASSVNAAPEDGSDPGAGESEETTTEDTTTADDDAAGGVKTNAAPDEGDEPAETTEPPPSPDEGDEPAETTEPPPSPDEGDEPAETTEPPPPPDEGDEPAETTEPPPPPDEGEGDEPADTTEPSSDENDDGDTEPSTPPTSVAPTAETTAAPPPPPTTAPTTPASNPEELTVAPLSTNPPDTFIHQTQTWYAYVDAGENLDVSFAKASNTGNNEATVRVRGPGYDQTCTVPAGAPGGESCDFTDLTSVTPGVWQIDYSDAVLNSDRYSWSIDVQNGTASIDGRVYSENYISGQFSAQPPIDLSLWYQSEQGFLYEAAYTDYHGVNSRFASDASGVSEDGTCVSGYQSVDVLGPSDDSGEYWLPSEDSPGTCGDPYKIFFENPDPSLPATAQLHDGSTVWLDPPVTLPTLSNFAFAPDSPTTRAGDFTFDVTGFTGQLAVQVDVNNDGDYGDPEDVSIPAAVAQDGTVTVPWDGLDGNGTPASPLAEMGARVAITQAGEIHFVNNDVELRGGLEVTALNGPDAGTTTLYWDDTNLDSAGRISTTPQVDGTGGVDSSGGVHGWACTNLASCNQNDGETGSWGDARQIDDWTYHNVNIEQTTVLPPGQLPPPLPPCPPEAFFSLGETGSDPSAWYSLDLVTADFTPIDDNMGDADIDRVNAIGYNMLDDRIYGIELEIGVTEATGYVVVIGANGEAQRLGPIPGLDQAGQLHVGDVSPDGKLYATTGSDDSVFIIDVDPSSPNFLTMTTMTRTDTDGDSGIVVGADWAFSPTGDLYTVTAGGQLRTMDPATGEVDLVADVAALPNGAYGGVFFDADGFLYAYHNSDGDVYRIDVATGQGVLFADDGPNISNNDGARCPLAPLPIDWGDAPDSYGTILASGGPRHAIPGFDAGTSTAPLMLGSVIDIETDGIPTVGADGDDTDDLGDEDGVTAPIYVAGGAATNEVTVSATNTSNEDAILAGWVDLDGSGTFDPGEMQQIVVAAGTGTQDYVLPFGPATVTGDFYARFRLFPDTTDPADMLPTGPAAAGEVEDYVAHLYENVIDKTVGGSSMNADGTHTVTYTIEVTRNGTGPAYDLRDVLRFGDAVSIVPPDPVATSGDIDPALLVNTWDAGTNTLTVANGVPIIDGETDVYTVTVTADVDAAALTFENSDCTLGQGESGTGFMNTATVTTSGNETSDTACREVSEPDHDKTVSSGPTAIGNGLYEVEYTITVTNAGAAASEYDLDDELLYGDPVTVTGATVANVVPGSITTNAGWDGETDLIIVTDEPIAESTPQGPEVHEYTVTVQFELDLEAVTFENMDCNLDAGGGESGTGLLNRSTMTVDQYETDEEDCPPPPAAPVHDKVVSAGPTPLGNGEYEVEYTITVSNASPTAGPYDLDDELLYGDATTIIGTPVVANVTPGSITTNPAWDGINDLMIVAGEPIGAGTATGPAVHEYTVTVQFEIDLEGTTFENSDCTLGAGESGTGLLNESTVTVNDVEEKETACPPPSGAPLHDKEVTSGPAPLGDGTYEVVYTITVSNASAGPGEYDLDDALLFGDAITVESLALANTAPGDITTNPDWDGVGDTMIVQGETIAGGTESDPEIHTYTVTVVVSVDGELATSANTDCELEAGESGTGMLNSSTITVNDETTEETACPPPPGLVSHEKEISSGPTELDNGNYEVEYTITVSNAGDSAAVYDLDDELQYGDGINVVNTALENTTPGDIDPNSSWDGVGDTTVVTGEDIDAATGAGPEVHVYVVRVEFDGVASTAEAGDCSLTSSESGTGLLNTAALTVDGATDEDDACTESPSSSAPPDPDDPSDPSNPSSPSGVEVAKPSPVTPDPVPVTG